jgi:pimeloyl-ACP methyl ester carboxylesterase
MLVMERMVEVNGVSLCTEAFGDPADPAILLVMGIGGSMLWWEEDFCLMLAEGGRFVIRYDHRDTGRSVTYPPGRPGYGGVDLTADAVGILDAHCISAAHVVGVSAGGGIAQEVALLFADRVLSLVLISTSPVTPGDRDLPPPVDAFGRFFESAEVDWSDADSVVDYQVGFARLLNGDQRRFDEEPVRQLVVRDVGRATDIAAVQNHDLIAGDESPAGSLSALGVPALVIHGTADPMFPLAHGEALAAEIPDARLLALEGAGHGVSRDDWRAVAGAIVDHTGRGL